MKWLALLVGLAVLGVMVWVGRVEAQSTLGVPTIGTITVTTNTLTVPWTAPSDNGGAAITAYDLQYIRTDADEGVAANWTVVEAWTSGGGTLEYALTDLPDGVQFDVQVRAENADGDIGDWSATVTGTTTDHGGTSSSATALTLGGSAIGRIEPTTDEDVFSIVLVADAELWIYTTGSLDTVGELLDASNTVLKESDSGTLLDSPSGFEFREELKAGTYYVRVSSFEERKAGSYRIHVQTFTDPGDTFETATEVTLDSATPGRIGPIGGNSGGDADYFKLVLTAATDIWVMAFGTNETEDEPLDTEGRLYGSDKSPLYWDDDSELVGNEEGFMFRQRLAAGTYYIRVNGYHRRDVGPYTLHVRTAAEPGSTASTATALTLRVPETGRITSRTDRDFFRLTIEADTYVFIYALTFDRALSLTPTFLDDQGAAVSMHVIPHANWAEQGLGPVSFSAWGKLEAGTYQIRIAPSGSATGSYLLDSLVSTYNRIVEQCTGITTPLSDPFYGCQWHLGNTGQFDGGAGEDINVESVWEGGNLGSGVNVAVVDNGLQSDHPDLSANVVTTRNHRYRGSGSVRDPFDTHGTAVAGLIAAAANDIGVRGVAPGASIYSYNLTADGVTTLDHQADAMTRNLMDTGVSNNSWGFQDDAVPHSPTALWEAAVARGVTQGYGGKGVVYVIAGGNGAGDNDDSNLDGRANFYAVTAACAVGYDDTRSAYSEQGANLWVCAPSDSTAELPEIMTTFPINRYTDGFGGTSAATPIVSGVVALVRAANANLSWRDVKLILAASARQNDPTDRGWSNGALQYGSTTEHYSFNHQYGFGVVDAQAAVTLAGGWPDHLPALRVIEVESGRLDIAIPDREVLSTAQPIVTTLDLDSHVDFIEFVEIEIDVEHMSFRDLDIQLLSPAGESSTLSPSAAVVPITFVSVFGFDGSHRFGSAKHLGEDAQGTWQLRLTDRHPTDTGTPAVLADQGLRPRLRARLRHDRRGDLRPRLPRRDVDGAHRHRPRGFGHHLVRPPLHPRRRHRLRRRQLDRGHRDRQRRRPRPHRERAGRRGEVPGPGPRRQRRRQRPLVRFRRPGDAAGAARRSPERRHHASHRSPRRLLAVPGLRRRRRPDGVRPALHPQRRPRQGRQLMGPRPERLDDGQRRAALRHPKPRQRRAVRRPAPRSQQRWRERLVRCRQRHASQHQRPRRVPRHRDGPAQRAREHRGRRGHRRARRGPRRRGRHAHLLADRRRRQLRRRLGNRATADEGRAQPRADIEPVGHRRRPRRQGQRRHGEHHDRRHDRRDHRDRGRGRAAPGHGHRGAHDPGEQHGRRQLLGHRPRARDQRLHMDPRRRRRERVRDQRPRRAHLRSRPQLRGADRQRPRQRVRGDRPGDRRERGR